MMSEQSCILKVTIYDCGNLVYNMPIMALQNYKLAKQPGAAQEQGGNVVLVAV